MKEGKEKGNTRKINSIRPNPMPAPQGKILAELLGKVNLSEINRKGKANYIQVPISNIKLIAEVNQISIDEAIELVRDYFNAGLIKE